MRTAVLCFVLVFAVAINANTDTHSRFSILKPPIVGGIPVRVTQYPYQAELQRSGKHHCGGSIISKQYILTAAHCVKNFPLDKIQVRVGSSDIGKGGQLYDITDGFVHELYNATVYDYDVAVLKVAKKMKIDNKTSKIVKLADSGTSLRTGDLIKVSGWGKMDEFGVYPKSLRAVTLPVISPKKCAAAFIGTSSKFTDRMYCAGLPKGGKDSCVGDSGGPAVLKKSLVQYGIVSWGRGCARGRFPGVYTAVPVVRGWIKQITGV